MAIRCLRAIRFWGRNRDTSLIARCPGALLPTLAASRKNVHRNLTVGYGTPLHLKRSVVSEQWTPRRTMDVHLDVETLIGLFVPLTHISHAGEQHREAKTEGALIKPLLA